MTEETRQKAIEAMGGEFDLMREIAREEAYRQVEAHVNSVNHVRQVAPPPAPGATEAMLHAMAVEKGTKSAVPTPATDKCEECGEVSDDKDPRATWCKQHITWSATTPPSAKYRPICVTCGGHGGLAHSSRDDCPDCGRLASQRDPTVKPTPTTEADIRAKDKAEREASLQRHLDRTQDSPAPSSEPTMETPSANGPLETIWLVWDAECRGWVEATIQQSDIDGTAHEYIRADVAAKEVSEAVRAELIAGKQAHTKLYATVLDLLGGPPGETVEVRCKRVVAERDAALRDAQYHSEAADMANGRADRAEARVKGLEAIRDELGLQLAAVFRQRDALERELTAANLAIESARKTLWAVNKALWAVKP